LGNTGESGLHNDVATVEGSEFTAYNSLVGGYTAAQLDNGYSGSNVPGYSIAGTRILAGGDNVGGDSYATTVGDATRLSNLKYFFTAFDALPTLGNTGAGYTAAAWDFHLSGDAVMAGAVNTGDDYYGTSYVPAPGLVKNAANKDSDVEGNDRIQSTAPDMGAYESPWTSLGAGGEQH
jgi:hypothetical protein